MRGSIFGSRVILLVMFFLCVGVGGVLIYEGVLGLSGGSKNHLIEIIFALLAVVLVIVGPMISRGFLKRFPTKDGD